MDASTSEQAVVTMVSTGRTKGPTPWNVKLFFADGTTAYRDGFASEASAVEEAQRLRLAHGLEPSSAGASQLIDILSVDLALSTSRRDEGIS